MSCSDFVGSYEDGKTPNPCVACNAHVKFHAAAFLADRLGFENVATGHYASVGTRRPGARAARGRDEGSDLRPLADPEGASRAYGLPARRLPQDGGAPDRRGAGPRRRLHARRARTSALSRTATTAASSARRSTAEPGEVVDRDGAVLGRHAGVVDFTVGQRRGIGVSAPTPLYVTEVRPQTERRSSWGDSRTWRCARCGSGPELVSGRLRRPSSVQVRYNSPPVPARSRSAGGGEWVARSRRASPGRRAGAVGGLLHGGQSRRRRGGASGRVAVSEIAPACADDDCIIRVPLQGDRPWEVRQGCGGFRGADEGCALRGARRGVPGARPGCS